MAGYKAAYVLSNLPQPDFPPSPYYLIAKICFFRHICITLWQKHLHLLVPGKPFLTGGRLGLMSHCEEEAGDMAGRDPTGPFPGTGCECSGTRQDLSHPAQYQRPLGPGSRRGTLRKGKETPLGGPAVCALHTSPLGI